MEMCTPDVEAVFAALDQVDAAWDKLASLPVHGLGAGQVLTVLERLETESHSPARLEGLPLFEMAAPAPVQKWGPSPAEEALKGLDPDGMSPREALEALYRLKGLL